MQILKSCSSKWLNHTNAAGANFAWQEGYGAFSVSSSQMKKTIAYIDAQKEHHRKKSFQEEFIEFLDKHRLEYDLRYVFK